MNVHPLVARLAAHRTAQKISQAKLAARTGWSCATIRRIESGQKSPTLVILDAYAAALHLEIGYACRRMDSAP